MTEVALRLGPVDLPGYVVLRSGIRWLCEDGHPCKPGEAVAFCNVGLRRTDGSKEASGPFADEARDLQIAFATPLGGRLRQASGLNQGGFQAFQFSNRWVSEEILGHITPNSARTDRDAELLLLMMAGRRMTGLAEGRSGLLTGWFERSRASKAANGGTIGTLLSLGTCELLAIRGEKLAFLEMLEAVDGPAQIVSVGDNQLVHSARVISEQIRRTPAARDAIAADLSETFGTGPATPDSSDWIFAGAMLNALKRSPANEKYVILTRTGLRSAGPPDAIVLSLGSEGLACFRHRRLGYTVDFHDFRLGDVGPAFRGWLRANFEPVRRDIDGIRADYDLLIDTIRAANPRTEILINNIVSTSGAEDIQNYSWFDGPLWRTLKSVQSKDMNLMLCDLAKERGIAIVDSDAIAAELGGSRSIRDGVHPNGPMQAEMRAEILRILRARRIHGFGSVS